MLVSESSRASLNPKLQGFVARPGFINFVRKTRP